FGGWGTRQSFDVAGPIKDGSRGSAFVQGACCPNQKERGPVARSNLIPAETSEIFPSLGKSDIAAAHRAALRHLGNTPQGYDGMDPLFVIRPREMRMTKRRNRNHNIQN